MLPTSSAREKFSRWREASRILVYDADSATLPPTSNLLGLMRKFRNEGFVEGKEIAWLCSGFNSLCRENPDLVRTGPPPEELDEDDEHAGEHETDGDPAPLGMSKTMSAPGSSTRALRAKQLPKAAFTSASTIPFRPKAPLSTTAPLAPGPQLVLPTPVMPRENPFSASASLPPPRPISAVPPIAGPSMSGPPIAASGRSWPSAGNRESFSLRLPPNLGRTKQGSATGAASIPSGPLYSLPTLSPQRTSLPAYREPSMSLPGRQVAFNPFFDTIRQNIELNTRDGKNSQSGEGISLKLPRRVRRRVGELPFEWLRQIARKSRHVLEPESSSDTSESDSVSSGDEAVVRSSPPDSPPRSSSPLSSPCVPRHRDSRQSSLGRYRSSSSSVEPSHSHSHSPPDAEELTRTLESQFYDIELSEQKRLLGVMERHSAESGKVIQEGSGVRGVVGMLPWSSAGGDEQEMGLDIDGAVVASFPFSITAGLEKGSKNRYRNIWPFEHARVRLRKSRPEDDDYMNASYVQPLGTTKRYIATQGPLPTTFVDFWTLCWEQNVHVIVMLTREIEGSSVKCGKYWEEGTYGPLRLKLLKTNDTPERERARRESEINGGFFSQHVQQQQPAPPYAKSKWKRKRKTRRKGSGGDEGDGDESTITRVFELTHTAYPQAPPRIVTQFQYLDWPDLNVPEDPRGVLHLMHCVDEAAEASRLVRVNANRNHKQWGEGPLYMTADKCLHDDTDPVVDELDVGADVDPLTGVSKMSRDNPPVLLHCSAGVGRTGGFIAVDAVLDGVRREMRKRREGFLSDTAAAAQAAAQAQATRSRSQSHSGSQSRVGSTGSPKEGEQPMDVDSSPKQPTLTMPVSVGDGQEVHVPVAGFADTVPMDVDDRQRPREEAHAATAEKMRGPVPLPALKLKASPELVEEVRRAAISASSRPAPASASGPSDESSDSLPTTHAGTGSRGTPNTTAAGSQTDTSTNSMVGRTAKLSMSSPSPPPPAKPDIPGGFSPPEQPAYRLDNWRSEVSSSAHDSAGALPSQHRKRDSDTLHSAPPSSEPAPLKEPRRLHDDSSPPLLSSYEEPIRRVVEDMREQRMSLCQSLRQYVFVHRAVIEGALMIVDEEKRRARREARRQREARALSSSVELARESEPVPELELDTTYATLGMSPGRAKRGASPTELKMEGLDGGLLLTKRPSLKRHHRQGTADVEMFQSMGAMMASAPSALGL